MTCSTILFIVSLAQIIHLAFGVYDEGSRILVQPDAKLQDQSEFGFTLAYQPGLKNLVIGAPRADLLGKVFSCDVNRINEKINCIENVINTTNLRSSRMNNPQQHFYLGASISAASNYFITCAPLWTATINRKESARGTCFLVFPNNTTVQYNGTFEQYIKEGGRYIFAVTGGIGWRTLIEEENDLLLVMKTSLIEDFIYTNTTALFKGWLTSHIKDQMRAILRERRISPGDAFKILVKNGIWNYWNVGYAVTAGKFFSEETVYAFSMLSHDMKGAIGFFRFHKNKLVIIAEDGADWRKPYTINEVSTSVTSMFGVSLFGADLNLDGRTDLLVGAAAHSDPDCADCGAVYIYLGGTMELMRTESRTRTIFGDSELSRFGTAIIAKDLDGDLKPEVIVSAPHKDSGSGEVYILSGMELYDTFMTNMLNKQVMLSDLKETRILKGGDHWRFGFSLQFVPSADNSCDALAVGAPGNNSVVIYECVQSINVTMSTRLIGDHVALTENHFTVEWCAKIKYPQTLAQITEDLTVSNSISGQNAGISESDISRTFSLSTKDPSYCFNVTVTLNDYEPEKYHFTTVAVISNKGTKTSAIVSPHSKLKDTLTISRQCKGEDCAQILSMEVTWSGKNPYVIGSTRTESISVYVSNSGSTSNGACVKMRMSGATVARVDGCVGTNGQYVCELPKLLTHAEYSIELTLEMTNITNLQERLYVSATLQDSCNEVNHSKDRQNTTVIPYEIVKKNIYLQGSSNRINVTDTEILDTTYSINCMHEYLIINNGSMTWKNLIAEILIPDELFIESTKVSIPTGKCEGPIQKNIGNILYRCIFDVKANSTLTVIATQIVTKTDIEKHLKNLNLTQEQVVNSSQHDSSLTARESTRKQFQMLRTQSQLILYLTPKDSHLKHSISTTVVYHAEQTLLNKTWFLILVGSVLAIAVLAIIALVMYKNGFFKRKQKERLKSFRESVRRQSTRKYLSTLTPSNADADEGLKDEDVGDDCPFDDAPAPTNKRPQARRLKNKRE